MRWKELTENITTLWHGGRNLETDYGDIKSQRKGRWEHGPGLYLTTHYDTAYKYAKGSGKIYKVSVELGNDIADVIISIDDAVDFVNRNIITKMRKKLISDLKDNVDRVGKLRAEVLVNLCLTSEALPSSRTNILRQFLIDHGVDYARTRYGGRDETVVVVINPKIIKKVEIIKAKDVSSDEHTLNIEQ